MSRPQLVSYPTPHLANAARMPLVSYPLPQTNNSTQHMYPTSAQNADSAVGHGEAALPGTVQFHGQYHGQPAGASHTS